MAFLYFFKVGPTVPITLVIRKISYNIPTSGATHWRVLVVLLVYSVKGGLFTFPVIFTGTASPRVLARYQSRAVNCTKLNILQTVSLTLLLCTVQDICIGHRLFCGHQRAQLSYLSVQGLHIVSSSSVWILQKKQILKTQKHTLLHINSSRTHHDSTTSF